MELCIQKYSNGDALMLEDRLKQYAKNKILSRYQRQYSGEDFDNGISEKHWLYDGYMNGYRIVLKETGDIITGLLDKKYIDTEWDDFTTTKENEKSLLKVGEWEMDHKGKWLIIHGPQGTGKTMLKNILIKDMMLEKNLTIYAGTMYGLYLEYLDSLKTGTSKKLLDSLGNKKLIVIDEIGRRDCSKAISDFMFELMDMNYNNEHSAILLTNLTLLDNGEINFFNYIDKERCVEIGVNCPLVGKSFRGNK